MCGIGLSVTWPPSAAVVSPPSLATSACAASWHVVEKRKTMYQIAPRARSGVFMVGGRSQKVWLRGLDSNQDNQLQRLACYQLHYPGPEPKSVAEKAKSAQRFQLHADALPRHCSMDVLLKWREGKLWHLTCGRPGFIL